MGRTDKLLHGLGADVDTTGVVTFTWEQVVDATSKIVDKAGPEFVYTQGVTGTCQYVRQEDKDTEPHADCLVGQALHALGVPLKVLREMDKKDDSRISHRGNHELEEQGYKLDTQALKFLSDVQYMQDGGATWLKAFNNAVLSS